MSGVVIRAVPFLALAVLTACGPRVLHVDDGPRPPRAPEQVQLFLDVPDRPYRTIGLIRSNEVGLFTDMEDRKRQVQAAAARIGADAVILGLMSDTGSETVVTTNSEGEVAVGVGSSDSVRVYGRAIVFTAPAGELDGRD